MNELSNINFPPLPVYGPYSWTVELNKNNPFNEDSPQVESYINKLSIKDSLIRKDYIEGLIFLSLIGQKSEQTYNAYRTEIERFMLWTWIIKEQSLKGLDLNSVNEFFEFNMSPLKEWVVVKREKHFLEANGEWKQNKNWAPFRVKESEFSARADKIKRIPSQKTLYRQFSILNAFFTHLMEIGHVESNYIPIVKKRSRYLIKDTDIPQLKRISDRNWDYVVDKLIEEANKNSKFERNLFVVITLKSLYLRISEISHRPNWHPLMSHFRRDENGLYWFTAFGKGNKKRRVSVSLNYLEFLERYRKSRNLTPFPSEEEDEPLIHKLKGRNGVTVRQATRLVEEAFELAIQSLLLEGRQEDASELKSASSHWLRHTGASQDTDRPTKHLSEDLGHESMSTTDRIYIQSDLVARGTSGSKRKI